MGRLLLVAIAVVVVPLLVVGSFLPTDYSFETSVVLQASPEKVRQALFPQRNWLQWANWQAFDPSVENEFSGHAGQEGEAWRWSSSGRFNGAQVLRTIAEDRLIYDVRINGSEDDGFNGERELRWTTEPEGTRLYWKETVAIGGRPFGGYIRALVRSGMRDYAEQSLTRLQTKFAASDPTEEGLPETKAVESSKL